MARHRLERGCSSVNRIDQRLIEDLIKSLFDFKFSLDQLKNITVNLVDKNGKQTDSYGEGDAPRTVVKERSSEPAKTPSGVTAQLPTSNPIGVMFVASDEPNRIWAKEPQLNGDYIEVLRLRARRGLHLG